MKHVLLIVVMLVALSLGTVKAQVFTEDFEGSSIGMTSSSSTGTGAWGTNTRLFSQGAKCDSAVVVSGSTTYLTTTNTFSTLGKYAVYLDFDHICKIEMFDEAYLEVSVDNGANWQRVLSINYLGTSQFTTQGNKFTELSYGLDWGGVNTIAPTQSWWRTEHFDISSLAANSATVQVRFALNDIGIPGPAGRNGWFLDNIIISASVSELIAPSIVLVKPIPQDTVLGNNPVTLLASISDASGIDTAICYYQIMPENITGEIGMSLDPTTVDTFSCEIPFTAFGRTTKYYIKAWDNSFAANNDSTISMQYIAKKTIGGFAEIGNPTSISYSTSPFVTNYTDARTQILYTAKEINAAGAYSGVINSIELFVTEFKPDTMSGFTIQMKSISDTVLTAFNENDFTTVYSNNDFALTSNGWTVFNLTNSFGWDGTSSILINICFDNDSYDDASKVKTTPTTGKKLWYKNKDNSTAGCLLTGGSGSTTNRPNIRFDIEGSGDLTNDIGVANIINPNSGVIVGSSYDVIVDLANYGVDTIVSAQINWSLDGVTKTPYTFGTPADSIFPNGIKTPITIGAETSTAGIHYIAAWSSLPNGSFDSNLLNDTAKYSFYGCSSILAGTYTIGTGADFATFTEAALALNQCGISAPVVFNINSGVYNEQITINSIVGSSTTNTVTFQSTTLDSSSVTLAYDAIDANDNYVIKLNGTSNVIIKNITIEAQDAVFARAIVLNNYNSNLSFSNNIIRTSLTNVNSDNMALIINTDSLGNDISIANNALINASTAIQLNGGEINSTNWNISNNYIKGHFVKGIELTNSFSPIITNNTVKADTIERAEDYFAIGIESSTGSPIITKNTIQALNIRNGYGIAVSNSIFDSLNCALIANNSVIIQSKITNYDITAGIISSKTQNVNIYNNSVNTEGNHSKSAAISLYDSYSDKVSKNINIVNNNLTNNSSGYVYYMYYVDTALWTSNNNNLYKFQTGNFAYIGSSVATYELYKTKSGDNTSFNIDPYYTPITGIKINNNLLNNTGVVLSSITDDINGVTRNTTTPDISAYEFEAQPWDILAVEILTPLSDCGLTNSETVTVRFKNIGSSDISGNFNASYQLGNSAVVTEAVTATITAGDFFNYQFATTVDLSVASFGHDSTFAIKAWGKLTGDIVALNDTTNTLTINSGFVPAVPTVADVTTNYGTTATITATGNAIYFWETETSVDYLSSGATYTTPILYDTTDYWVSDRAIAGLQDYTIGTGTSTSSSSPMNLLWGFTYSQTIYTAAQFNYKGGAISGIKYNLISPTGIGPDDVKVYIGTTPNSEFSTTSSWLPLSDLTLVFDDTISGPAGGGWVNITFNSPFNYNGIDNLVIAFDENTSGYYTGSDDFKSTVSTDNVTLYKTNDYTNPDPASPPSGTLSKNFANTKFTMQPLGCFSPMVPVTAFVQNFPAIDAGMASINSPSGSIPASTGQNFDVSVTNFGTSALTSLDINYKIDNGTVATYNWTGSIASQQTQSVNVGNISVPAGVVILKVWTSNPNGATDLTNTNDTIFTTLTACLHDTYTIGTGSTYDFTSILSATQTLNEAGVCDDVIFEIADGTYNENFEILDFTGTGANNTVTFTSASNDSSLVIIENTNTSTDNYVVNIDGADYLTFKNLSFKAIGTTNTRIFVIEGNANHINILNNKLESGEGTSTSSCAIYSSDDIDNYITIANNYFYKSYKTIHLEGVSSTNHEKGHIIKNNFIEGFKNYGIHLTYVDSSQVLNNIIKTTNLKTSEYSSNFGIMLSYSDNAKVDANQILISAVGPAIGIQQTSCKNVDNRSLISNNTVRIYNGAKANRGIQTDYSKNTDIVFNTFFLTDGNTSSAAIDVNTSSSTDDLKINNNIFYDSLGYTVFFNGSGVSEMDYNTYYTSHTTFAKEDYGSSYNSLDDYRAYTSTDVHSFIYEPNFTSDTNLHLADFYLSGLGIPTAGVTTDMDGDSRDASRPTIGADEKDLAQFDIGIIEILDIADTIFEGTVTPSRVIVKNFGYDAVSAYAVSYSINGASAVSQNVTTVIAPNTTDTITIAAFTATASNSEICFTTVLSTDLRTINDGNCQNFYGFPTKDAEIVEIISITEECNMTYDSVKVRVTNIGLSDINAAGTPATTISYKCNNNSIITEPFTAVVAPFDTVWYTFNTAVYVGTNNVVDSVYNITAWINFDSDINPLNDSIKTIVNSPHSPVAPVYTNPLSVVYGNLAVLDATSPSNDNINWFIDNTSSSSVLTGNQFTTDWNITQDTSMWLSTIANSPGFTEVTGTDALVNTATGFPTAFGNYFKGMKEQYLILASELDAMGLQAGPITKIAFDIATMNSCPTLKEYKVSIGASSLSNITAWEVGLTPVFNQATHSVSLGWNEIPFITPFNWDGISNIVIEVCSQSTAYVYSGNASVNSSNTSFTSTLSKRADAAGICAETTTTSNFDKRPNIKITGFGAGCSSSRVEFDIIPQAQAACDVSVTDAIDLIDGIYLTANEDISIEVTNFGSASQSSIPVSYSINGGTVVNETITTSLAANSSMVYTFATQADLNTIASYDFEFYTDLTCDVNNVNDTLDATMSHILPEYCISASTSTSAAYIKSITIGNDNNDSPTPLNVMYTDFTSLGAFTTLSPSVTYQLSIGLGTTYSYTDSGFVKVYIDYNRDGAYDPITEYAFGSKYDNIAGGNDTIINGSFTVNSNVNIGTSQMRVVCVKAATEADVEPCGTYSYGETEDYEINIAPQIPQDAGIEEILNIQNLTDLSTLPLEVRVRNYGTSPITSVDIVYEVNTVVTTFTYNTTIAVGDSSDVTVGNISLNMGQNSICVKTVLTGDVNFFNDSRCLSTYKQAFVNLAYTDDFEGTDLWMVDQGSTQWERGVPTMSNINTAHSPVNVWAIGLDTNYDNNSMEYLYTPKFNTMNIDSATLKFWHFYQTETDDDGGYIQYRKNSDSWLQLGYIGHPKSTNWYTHNVGGTYMWTGDNNTWQESSFTLDFTNSGAFPNTDTIQFRYIFYSNSYTSDSNGWAIDDFSFELPIIANDAGVTNITSPITTVQAGSDMTVTIEVENFGSANQSSFDVWYKVGALAAVTETFTPTGGLAAGATATYTFSATASAPSADFSICSGTELTGDAYPQNDDFCSNNINVTAAAIDGGIIAIDKIQNYGGDDTTSILSPVVLTVEIKNFGINPLTSFDVQYSIDGGTNWTTETWTGNLASNAVDNFQFTTTFNSPIGNYSICARTVITNDANTSNDMLCNPYIGSAISNANGIIFEVTQNEPNPAVGNVRINYTTPSNGDIRFELRNTLGQLIYTAEQASFTGKNTIEVDADKLANGVYYYSVIFDNQRITRKMVVNQ